jgi:GR25 family glycosyltransferase involved in LPS biosynthesis
MNIAVISLERTTNRWQRFLARNSNLLDNCKIEKIYGFDGKAQNQIIQKARIISQETKSSWTYGALGAALSHIYCWKICVNKNKSMVIMEDDVLLANNWQAVLKTKVSVESKLVLLGWNLDSMLQAEMFNSLEIISLFKPTYPNETAILKILNQNDLHQIRKLNHCFGLPAYWITPNMAKELLNMLLPIKIEQLILERGFPKYKTEGIDGNLNLYYEKINAEIIIPPVALALNNRLDSLTNNRYQQFGG